MGIYGAAALFPLPPVRAVVKCPWNISANSSPSIIFVFRTVVSGSSFSLGIGYIPRYGEFEAFFDRVEHVRSSNNTRVLREIFHPQDFVVIRLDFSVFFYCCPRFQEIVTLNIHLPYIVVLLMIDQVDPAVKLAKIEC